MFLHYAERRPDLGEPLVRLLQQKQELVEKIVEKSKLRGFKGFLVFANRHQAAMKERRT